MVSKYTTGKTIDHDLVSEQKVNHGPGCETGQSEVLTLSHQAQVRRHNSASFPNLPVPEIVGSSSQAGRLPTYHTADVFHPILGFPTLLSITETLIEAEVY